MNETADRDFGTALLTALVREAGAFAGRGMSSLSSGMREQARELPQFVLVDCKPLAARLYIVHPDGSPHEYYRETGDMVSDRFAHLVREFVSAGMNSLSPEDRRRFSRRLEVDSVRLAVAIEAGAAVARGLMLGPGGRLAGSDELFSLVAEAERPSG